MMFLFPGFPLVRRSFSGRDRNNQLSHPQHHQGRDEARHRRRDIQKVSWSAPDVQVMLTNEVTPAASADITELLPSVRDHG